MLDLVVDQLLERLRDPEPPAACATIPFLMGQGVWLDSEKLGPDDEVREVLKHGTLSIGFIGLAESAEGADRRAPRRKRRGAGSSGLEIIGHMRDRADAKSRRQRGLNFTLPGHARRRASPAASSGWIAKRFGVIPGVTDREYYTNSFHVPVYYPISAFNKIRIEAPYHALTNAGHISYVETGRRYRCRICAAFEKVVRFMKASAASATAPSTTRSTATRSAAITASSAIPARAAAAARTPDQPFERIRRITGYLVGTLDRFNNGKRAEERDRVKHGVTD